MSKDSKVMEETVKKDSVEKEIDYKTKCKESEENLKIQLQESLQQIEFHKMRATKIQGALEVHNQIFGEEGGNESK